MTVENEQPSNPETADLDTTDTAVTEANASATDAVEAENTGDADAVKSEKPADEEPNEQSKRDPRIPEVITNRTLFFLAPDLPPVHERPTRGRRPHDEADEEESESEESYGGRRPARGRGRSRRGSRNQDRRDGRQQGADREDDRREDQDADEAVEEKELITEPQKVQGSTRLAAKRARRREGRDTGRRRVAVTESEFQARRESVDRQMLVRAKNNRVQIGVIEDNILVEHYVARNEDVSLIGNVYVGRVQNVLPSMEAAFIDIGGARNAVLYSGEVDWAAAEMGANQPRKIENALKSGDKVLVQVTKDPVGHKGARLTSQVSLPGRYLVYVPGNTMNGISRKLPDTERARLKKILKDVLPEGVGVIVRTAAEGATQEQLQRDVERLTKQWEDIQRKSKNSSKAPQTLHSESDMLVKIVRDVFNEDFDKLIVQGQSEIDTIKSYLGQVAPDLLDRVERFNGDDIFTEYRVNDMIEKALARKVWLPSGGSLVIDRTEAMTVVDVNTGKFVGTGGNLEETVTKNNLEAADEIVRQLRLRDIGGIIVIDFIDMVLESNRDLVQRRLVEGLSRDRTKHQVAELTSLGLVQMTRKKIGLGLLETFSEACTHCDGRGVVIYGEPVSHNHGAQASNNGRKSRGSRNRGKGQSQNTQQNEPKPQHNHDHANGSTHEITEDARNALTKIAASTIAGNDNVESHEAESEVKKVVDAATKEIVKVVKQIESGKGANASKGQDAQDSSSKRRPEKSAPANNEQQDSASEDDAGQGTGQRRSGSGSSRRSRRSRRVRTDATQPAEMNSGNAETRDRSEITIDLPEPAQAEKAVVEPDPKQVEAVMTSLDEVLDSLVAVSDSAEVKDAVAQAPADATQTESTPAAPATGASRSRGARRRVTTAGTAVGKEAKIEAPKPEEHGSSVSMQTAPEPQAPMVSASSAMQSNESEQSASTSTGRRQRGARRRISTGPISTDSTENE